MRVLIESAPFDKVEWAFERVVIRLRAGTRRSNVSLRPVISAAGRDNASSEGLAGAERGLCYT